MVRYADFQHVNATLEEDMQKCAHGSYKYTFEFACIELQSSTKYFETLLFFGKISIHHYYKLNPYNFIRNILRKIKKSSKLGNIEKL